MAEPRSMAQTPMSFQGRMHSARRRSRKVIIRHAENILYRMCGLPTVFQSLAGHHHRDPEREEIRRAYVRTFWSPDTVDQWFDVLLSIALFPVAVLLSASWYSLKNGKVVARRSGRPVLSQFADQVRFAVGTGLLPPWYYIFELFVAENRVQARDFLTRAETKQCIFPILSSPARATSPLGDKAHFAFFCEQKQLFAVPAILVARRGEIEWRQPREVPRVDLFLKPVDGRGGRGAERWDFTGEKWKGTKGVELDAEELLARIANRSSAVGLLLQPRIRNHPALEKFSNGAFTTIRVLTCLNEQAKPEIVGAVFRMAIGANRTVDNFHAGGILAAIDLGTGCLGRASNLGTDARLGWLDVHPDTGQQITGERIPMWEEVKELALSAHEAFCDRAIIGWDIGIGADGPILVEGNYGPDVDMMQRPTGVPLGRGRFAQLIAFHLQDLGRQRTATGGMPVSPQ